MGMFDTIHVDCVECGRHVELQSKSGPCQMLKYDLSNVPSDVASAYVDLGKADQCEHCGTWITLYRNYYTKRAKVETS